MPAPNLSELSAPSGAEAPDGVLRQACAGFNGLNTRIRDGKVGKNVARMELKRLLDEVRGEYYRQGGADYGEAAWVFPVAGYDIRAIDAGKGHGYVPKGYDYFSGNRHGGHPSLDIFIRDRNRDSLDDRTAMPVRVLSMTGGVVVATERQWEPGSRLRGGKYIWLYDPGNDLLVYYAHNSEVSVKPGDMVRPGDQLAVVGRSGFNAEKRRSPTHLHLTVLRVAGGRMIPVEVYSLLGRARTAVR